MRNPTVLPADMKLYSPAEPEGRVFLKGEPWPGDAWSDKPGGEPAGSKAAEAAFADLATARGQIESLQAIVEKQNHDLAQRAKEAADATAALKGAEQRAADAERAKAEAEEIAREQTAKCDQMAANETGLRQRIAALEAEVAKMDPDGDGKIGGRRTKAKPEEDGGL